MGKSKAANNTTCSFDVEKDLQRTMIVRKPIRATLDRSLVLSKFKEYARNSKPGSNTWDGVRLFDKS